MKQKSKTRYEKPLLVKMSYEEVKRERHVAFFCYLLERKTASEWIAE